MSGLDGLGWPNPEDEPKPNKTMNSQLEIKLAPTPETDAENQRIMESWNTYASDHCKMLELAQKLERERDRYQESADALVDRLGVTQERMVNAERERDEWKAKYIQQNKDLGCEMMDPNGTIWDYAKKVQRELTVVTKQRDQLEERLRVELGGHPDSELWGDAGLIAATMRCVDALDGVTEQRDYYKLACDKYSEDEMMNTLQSLKGERDEAREYADKLVAHKDMVCLPKDLEVLREANLGLAVELNEAQNEILGWKNKWDCAIEMGARAECERDEMTLRRNLAISLLDEECALADRLGTELEIALSRPCPRSGESIKALTAWKEARK